MRIPALLEKKLNLKSMSLLIVDGNDFSRNFTREVCRAFKFRDIHSASTSTDALQSLQSNDIDMMITDWLLEPDTGGVLTRDARRLAGIRNPYLPIIILSGVADKETIAEARDAGANEFMARPFELRQLLARFVQVLLSPRPFVRCPTYVGPDRRRGASTEYTGPERRAAKRPPIRPPSATAAAEKAASPGGVTVKTMVEEGQKVIVAEEKRYTEVRRQDLDDLSALFEKLRQASLPDLRTVDEIYHKANGLKAMGQTFGFPLLTQAGDSLCRILWKLPVERIAMPVTIQGIEAHVKTMRLIVEKDIRHDGGKVGSDLIAGLRSLVGKIAPESQAVPMETDDTTLS